MDKLLTEAIEDENYAKALELLDKGADPNALVYGEEPIILMVAENDSFVPGDEEFDLMVRLLIKLAEKGADLTADNGNEFGLICNCFQNNIPIDTIRHLISLGANLKNAEGDMVNGSLIGLSYALKSLEDPQYVLDGLQMLNDIPAEFNPEDLGTLLVEYFYHAQSNFSDEEDEEFTKYVPFARKLLEMGANINAQGISGHTAIMRASMNCFPRIVDFLLDCGADPNKQSNEGNTALMFVSGLLAETSDRGDEWQNSNSQLEVAKILLNNGANKNLINKDNLTAIDLAEEFNNLEMVRLLK